MDQQVLHTLESCDGRPSVILHPKTEQASPLFVSSVLLPCINYEKTDPTYLGISVDQRDKSDQITVKRRVVLTLTLRAHGIIAPIANL